MAVPVPPAVACLSPSARQGLFAATLMLSVTATSGANALQCAAGTIKFHPDGGIQQCVIDANHRLHTAMGEPVDCTAGHAVALYASGKLKSCHIVETHAVQAKSCAGPARIELDEAGMLRSCRAE